MIIFIIDLSQISLKRIIKFDFSEYIY